MQKVTLHEAADHLPELIKAAMQGDDVFIVKDEEEIVQLVPVTDSGRHPKFGSARGLITIAEDFDAPLDDFAEYSG